MKCIYCGRETGDAYDEHEECVEDSMGDALDEEDDDVVLGVCAHGVDLDRAFCPHGCRV